MSLNLGDLFYTLGIDDSKLGTGFAKSRKQAESEGDKGGKLYARAFMGPIRAAGTAAAGLFAVDKLTGFLKDSVQGYQDHLRVVSLTNQVIKSTGGAANVTTKQVNHLTDSIEANTGVDGDLVQAGANMLLTFKNIRNEAGKGNDIFNQTTQAVTDLSVATGQDAKNSAIQLGKALNDPIAGMSALSRVGITFSASQQKAITKMEKSGNILGAQKVILKEVNSEFGGAAKAAETPADKLMVVYRSLQDQVGSGLLPVFTKFLGFLTTTGVPALTTFIGSVEAGHGTVGHLASGLVSFGGVVLTQAIALAKFGYTLGKEVLPYVVAFGTKTAAVLLPILRSLVAWVSTKLLPSLRSMAEAFGRDILPLIISLARYFQTTVIPVGLRVAKVIGTDLVGAIRSVTGFLKEHKTTVQAVVVGLAAGYAAYKLIRLGMLAWAAATRIVAVAQAALNAVMDANPIALVVIALAGLAAGLIYAYKHSQTFRRIVNEAFHDSKVVALDFVHFFTKQIPAAFSTVVSFVKKHWYLLVGIIGGPLSIGIATVIHFRKQIAKFFTDLWHDVSHATSSGVSTAVNYIKGLPGRALRALGNLSTYLVSKGDALIGGLVTGAENKTTHLLTWIGGMGARVLRAMGNLGSTLTDKGAALIAGFMNGVVSPLKDAYNWVKKHIFNPIKNAIVGLFKIHSPSRVMSDLGGHVMGGFVKGLLMHDPVAIAKNLVGGLPKALESLVKQGFVKVAQLSKKGVQALQGVGYNVGHNALGKYGLISDDSHPNQNAKANQAYAQSTMKHFGWGPADFKALVTLWNNESGWNQHAQNPTSSAYGIAQFLDSTWSGFPYGKTSDPNKQIVDGEMYIQRDYNNPRRALAEWMSRNPHWYDNGGILRPGMTLAMNGTGRNERIRTGPQEDALQAKTSMILSMLSGDAMAQAVRKGMHGAELHIKGSRGMVKTTNKINKQWGNVRGAVS